MPTNAMVHPAVFPIERTKNMAAFETTYIPVDDASFGGRLTKSLRGLIASYRVWSDARATRKVLSKLSDRALDDIGLCRGDIERL